MSKKSHKRMPATDSGKGMTALKPEFISMLVGLLGDEKGQELAGFLDTPPETSIRLNGRKTCPQTLYKGMEPVPWCEKGFYLPSRPSFTLNPLFHCGAFYVQDASSMIHHALATEVSQGTPLAVLDLCAAPGGKTTAVIDALPDGSVIVANEYDARRAQILKENLSKWGYPDIMVTNAPADHFSPMKEEFDLVIVDAPCSGEGMMRKEDVARTQWSEGLVKSCSCLQRKILRNALPTLKRGGHLIYSTCTFNTHEDEGNVKWLCEEFGLENIPLQLKGTDTLCDSLTPDIHALRFFPGQTRGEGLFVALLRKPDGSTQKEETDIGSRNYKSLTAKDSGRQRQKKGAKSSISLLKETGLFRNWVKSPEDVIFMADDQKVSVFHKGTERMLTRLPDNIRLLSSGVETAHMAGKDLVPSQELAWSTLMEENAFPRIELDESDALDYLRGAAIRIPENQPKGFLLVTFRDQPLGFVKNIGSRANNLYPKGWRIHSL